jgi:hypothetical protein
MKICSKCKKLKKENEFYTDKRNKNGLYACCKDCYQKYWEKYYKVKNNLFKMKSRNILAYSVIKKEIKKLPCKVCGNVKSEAHHDDYDFPLKIKWLCRKHHKELHNKIKK